MTNKDWLLLNKKVSGYILAKIKAKQKESGESVVATMKRAGIQPQQWYRIMKGDSGTTRETIEHIASAVELSLDSLFDEALLGICSELLPNSEAGEKAAVIVNTLTPEVREHAMASLEAFKLLSANNKGNSQEDGETVKKELPPRSQRYANNKVPKDRILPEPTKEDLENGKEDEGNKEVKKRAVGRKR